MIRDGDFVLLEWDEKLRRAVWVKDDGDGWIVRTDYHAMDQLLDHNSDFSNADSGKKMGDYVRIASVPQFIVDQHDLDTKMRDDPKALSRFLNDSDNRKFRTREGKF